MGFCPQATSRRKMPKPKTSLSVVALPTTLPFHAAGRRPACSTSAMAPSAAPEIQELIHHPYDGRVTSFVVLSCVTACLGGIIFGYDIGVSGGVTSMDAFLERFFPEVYRRMHGGGERVSNYCRFDSQLLTAFTSSLYVAGLATTFLASHVTARRGRRASMLLFWSFGSIASRSDPSCQRSITQSTNVNLYSLFIPCSMSLRPQVTSRTNMPKEKTSVAGEALPVFASLGPLVDDINK
uniref:Major facilitator superfamily (MFS) profile domain-containing protein n=1 Tax=Oryza barthii TaxID=65489 RepID=A0A0D3GLY8_9ORYZ